MIARSEITNRIQNRRHFEKGRYPKKWIYKLIVHLPDCRHMEKGNEPKKQTSEKGNESQKVDSGQMYMNSKNGHSGIFEIRGI